MRVPSAIFLVFGLAFAATSASAGEKTPPPGTTVEMPYVMAPMIVDDKLVAYAYFSPKIIATSQSAAIDIRDKTPFLQDAFVRDVNGASIATKADPAKVDSEALLARLLRDARRIMGSGKVASVSAQIQIAQLRPASGG
ncbi:MAG TPA: hypothetical protein VGG69_05935 [Rhizomicrobium sp.]|jgi:hypothetical protein